MSSFRNKKKTALTLVSLGIGGVLYMLAAFWVSSTDEESYARQGDFAYGDFVIDYSYNLVETAEHGEAELRTEHPMDSSLTGKIEGIDGVEQVIPVENLPVSFETHGDDGNVRVGPLSKDRQRRFGISYRRELCLMKIWRMETYRNDGRRRMGRDIRLETGGWR